MAIKLTPVTNESIQSKLVARESDIAMALIFNCASMLCEGDERRDKVSIIMFVCVTESVFTASIV